MSNLRRWILIGIAAALGATAFATEPTYSRIGALSLSKLLEKQAAARKNGLDVPDFQSPVHLYKVRYASKDTHGQPASLTGLLIMPKTAPKGLVVYFHSTCGCRDMSPSRYTGSNESLEAEYVMLAFASGGYAVAMPDYLGLGDDEATVHPYPGSEENSGSGIDMIAPSRALAKRAGVVLGKQLFIAGYSQGGAVAMCTVRRLERSHQYSPAMAAPMSGPYDLSGETAQSLLKGNQSMEGLAMKLFLIGYAAYSISSNKPSLDLKNYFAPSFATYVPFVFGQHLSDVATAKKLVVKAIQMGAIHSIIRVLSPKFYEALKWSDATNPMIAELTRSDCYDWTPHTKMLLPYLKGDDVVVPENTLKAIDAMRVNGVGTDMLRPYPIDDPKLSHSTAAPLAFAAARRFFDNGFAGVWAKR